MKTRNKRLLLVASLLAMVAILVVIAGCAPKQNTEDTGQNTGPGIQLAAWTIDVECTECHAYEVASMTDTTTVYAPHYSWENLVCTDCHNDDDGSLTKAHADYATAAEPTRLTYSRVDKSSCFNDGCHNAESLAESAKDSTALTDKNGTVVNPHDLPQVTAHASIVCGSCHKLHEPNEDTGKTASDLCVGCHHEDVYECNTCHPE